MQLFIDICRRRRVGSASTERSCQCKVALIVITYLRGWLYSLASISWSKSIVTPHPQCAKNCPDPSHVGYPVRGYASGNFEYPDLCQCLDMKSVNNISNTFLGPGASTYLWRTGNGRDMLHALGPESSGKCRGYIRLLMDIQGISPVRILAVSRRE